MYRFILILLFCAVLSVTTFARELHFDSNGNLIDHKLDKTYKLTARRGIVFTHKFQGFSIENVLYKNKYNMIFNIGFTLREKYLFTDISKSLYKDVVFAGFGYGYSFNHHQPYSCVIFSIRLF